jgi:imidazolonepropionase-like amidohydrolase
MERVAALETMNLSFENAAILARRGIPITFQSGFEDYVPRTHVVRFEAAVACAWGLGFDAALRALTLDAARRLRVDERVGSLEPGKDADLVLFDGDPFEYTTHVEAVVVNGSIAWRRE